MPLTTSKNMYVTAAAKWVQQSGPARNVRETGQDALKEVPSNTTKICPEHM